MSTPPASTLVDQLAELEAISRRLELDASQRKALLGDAERLTDGFLPTLAARPVFSATDPDVVARVAELDPTEQGAGAGELFDLLDAHVAQDGLHEGSPRFFAFIPGGGLYASAVADYVAAALNRYVGVDFAAPGAARLERRLVSWLIKEVGFPLDTSGGDLTSGGSIANLSAIVAAREGHAIKSRDVEQSVVYVSKVTHHSCLKALAVAGLREAQVRYVPCDDAWRMDANKLAEIIAVDRRQGLQPWLIVANAGATDTGGIDPLNALADIARHEKLWLHVDAAYGGAFVLCDEGRHRLSGMSRADSVTLDPHKGLFLPFGSGAVLVRDARHLYAANHARGAYMQDLDETAGLESASACDLSPELTRPFRGLRLWLPLRLFGLQTFRAALAEKLLLAQYAYSLVGDLPNVEVGPAPDLSIFLFRYVPKHGSPEEVNKAFAGALRDDGRVFLSSTSLNGKFMMRFAILNYHSHRKEVDVAVAAIREVGSKILSDFS